MKYIVHTDGGARGNPGKSAIGVVIEKCACDATKQCLHNDAIEIAGFGKRIPDGTNNVAEYTAVIAALEYLQSMVEFEKGSTIDFYLDSLLVVNQLNGIYKVKDAHLRELLMNVRGAESELDATVTYSAVPREQNRRADFFVNSALDAHQ